MKRTARTGRSSDKIFELPPNDHGPLRIGRVMHDDPEKTAGAKREEKCKAEQPGETELPRRQERADHAQIRDQRPRSQPNNEREPGETARSRNIRLPALAATCRTLAHFFAASGVGAGFVSAGLSKSARCSGGTSAAVAFWLRCNARR